MSVTTPLKLVSGMDIDIGYYETTLWVLRTAFTTSLFGINRDSNDEDGMAKQVLDLNPPGYAC